MSLFRAGSRLLAGAEVEAVFAGSSIRGSSSSDWRFSVHRRFLAGLLTLEEQRLLRLVPISGVVPFALWGGALLTFLLEAFFEGPVLALAFAGAVFLGKPFVFFFLFLRCLLAKQWGLGEGKQGFSAYEHRWLSRCQGTTQSERLGYL